MMTPAQKVIKYLALAFAIFLIITIISSILSGGYLLLRSVGLINSKEENTVLKDMVTLSKTDDITTISSLEMKVTASNLKIVKGDKFEVKTNNSDVKYSNKDGKVVIKDEKTITWPFDKKHEEEIVVILPEDIGTISEINLKVELGDTTIENLNVKDLNLKLGLGTTTIDNLIVSNKAKIDAGVGSLNIKFGKITNLDCDLGVGETNITSDIIGNSKIDAGLGEFNLNLVQSKEAYKLDIEKALGSFKINNINVSDNSILGTGENYIKISAGIGSINVKTYEN